jgi:DDE_Tnp_1-associated
VLAVITGGSSFRSIETFIKVHRRRLNAVFGLHWKRAPAHTAISYILQGLDPQAVERVFRRHAAALHDAAIRQTALLCLQHPASQSDFNVQSGSLRRRSRRCQPTPQVDLQLRALNSPGLI